MKAGGGSVCLSGRLAMVEGVPRVREEMKLRGGIFREGDGKTWNSEKKAFRMP